MTDLADPAIAESLERIIFAGVALTTVAFSNSQPEVELTFPQWRVLVILGAAPDGLRIAEVARMLGVTLPATSRQLRRLERRGLIAVRPDARDRRASLANLTPEGRAARAAIIEYRRARIEAVAAPHESNASLRRDLDRIADALEAAPGD
jgi:DNA-binding MarR family transcriptional regulator